MLKQRICLSGCILHCLLAALVLVWVVFFSHIPGTVGLLITVGTILVFSIVIGTAILKLTLDKLFLKLETNGATKRDRAVLLAASILMLCIIAFEIIVVAIYFFRGIKMEPIEFIRFTVLPSISIAHLAIGLGGYFGWEYYRTFSSDGL